MHLLISVNVPRLSAPPMLFGGSRTSVGGGRGVKEEADDGDGATVAQGAKPMQSSLAGSDTYW